MAMDRLGEPEARILALRIAASQPGREATTSFIKSQVPHWVTLTDIDLQPADSRNRERKWQQIVGNVVSHRGDPPSIFSQGYAEYTGDGLRVTEAGLTYLDSLGL